MSADDWQVCPKCAGSERLSRTERLAQLDRDYGKIPANVFARKYREVVTR